MCAEAENFRFPQKRYATPLALMQWRSTGRLNILTLTFDFAWPESDGNFLRFMVAFLKKVEVIFLMFRIHDIITCLFLQAVALRGVSVWYNTIHTYQAWLSFKLSSAGPVPTGK